jgi:hypothetical protein
MSSFSNLPGGNRRVQIQDGTGGAFAAQVTAANALKVTGTFAPAPPTTITALAPTAATVGVASATVVAANAARTGLILRNMSASGQRISLGFSGNAAVLDNGVTLNVNDVFNMGQYDFTLGIVTAIASAASASLQIQEFS